MTIKHWEPETIEDHYDANLVNFIKNTNFNDIPHLLFYGTPGTGKTEFTNLLAYHFLGADCAINFFEYNSSVDRGIDIIRNEIKEIAATKSLHGLRKIIFLDEADFLTSDAQAALRRIMDTTSNLFILTANYEHKLIPAIRNRTSSFHFTGPSKEWSLKNLLGEGVDESILKQAIDISGRSFRDIKSNYEKLKFGEKVEEKKLDLLTISSKEFIDMSWKINDPSVLIRDLHEQILKCDSKNKAKALVELAEVDYRCALSTNKYLQLQTGYIKIRNILKG